MSPKSEFTVSVENIGGISDCQFSLRPGINIVSGDNWSGKSSVISAIEGAIGTESPLAFNQTAGKVEVAPLLDENSEEFKYANWIPDEGIEVNFERRNGEICTEGGPILTNEVDLDMAADFACLRWSNSIRSAIREEQDIGSLLGRPHHIRRLENRIKGVQEHIIDIDEDISKAKQRRDKLEALQDEFDYVSKERNRIETEIGKPRWDQTTEVNLRPYKKTVLKLKAVKDEIAVETKRLRRYEQEFESVDEAYQSINIPPRNSLDQSLSDTRARITHLQKLSKLVDEIQVVESKRDSGQNSSNSTEENALPNEDKCWGCGEVVFESNIQEWGEQLTNHAEKVENELVRKEILLQNLKVRSKQIRELQSKRLVTKIALRQLKRRIQKLTCELDTLRNTRFDLENQLESFQDTAGLPKKNELQIYTYWLECTAEIRDLKERIGTEENRVNGISDFQTQKEDSTAEISALRRKIAKHQHDARNEFNEALEEVQKRLDPTFDSIHLTEGFHLVIVRDGLEISLDALSEAERELVAFIVVLAGYKAYNVQEFLPVVLIDEVGMFSNATLSALLEYLEENIPIVICTAFPDRNPAEKVPVHEIRSGESQDSPKSARKSLKGVHPTQ